MNTKEIIAAKVDDLKDGEMKKISHEGSEFLLCKIEGKIYAVGATCTHYGAPLEQGLLYGDRIVCPWHHACFNAKTGDLQEPPARDALPMFEVKIAGNDVIVKLPEKIESHRVPAMAQPDLQRDKRTFAILGAGAAGNAAAQALREDGFQGRIVMITQENRLPYDRPNLSKDYLQGKAEPEWMPLRSEEFYQQYGIEIMRQKKVARVDIAAKQLVFENGGTLAFDTLLLATGGKPRTLDVPGVELKNIFTLRSFDDADAIIQASEKARQVAIIGASFIGMEAAFSLSQRKLAVTVIAPTAVPFERVFGREIGKLFQELHEKNGVTFKLGSGVAKFEGNDQVKNIVLASGEKIAADLVLIGIGVQPATDFLQGLDRHADGSVKVDQYFRVAENVYAAGDIARFPDWRTGEYIRIEHWRTAEQQGRLAGHNMAGKKIANHSVPFFWTTQAGLNLRYVGHVHEWDDLIIHGAVASQEFIVFYVKNNQVLAAAGNQHDREMDVIEELMHLNKMPKPQELRDASFMLRL